MMNLVTRSNYTVMNIFTFVIQQKKRKKEKIYLHVIQKEEEKMNISALLVERT